jgi:cystathionine beta-lyase/cystathionine gamma-synthase
MKQHKKIATVIFPFDESFSQYELARKQMTGACGLFTFILETKRREEIVKFCESLRHILMAVSWGGHESLVIPKCAGIRPGDFNGDDPWHRSLRMYVGLEEPSYLIADMEQAFAAIH